MPEPFVVDGVWIPKAIIGIRSRFAIPLYCAIRQHAFEQPECWPSVRRLAKLVGCAVGTVSALTDEFHRLGIVTKLHAGRRCVYRFAAGCWHRRKSRRIANRSANRTEDRSNFVESTDRAKGHTKIRVSLPAASNESRNKRHNMIKSLRRWCQLSPALPEAERPHRLQMLGRAEAQLDDWSRRTPDDKRCLEMLISRARATPLDDAVTDSLRQRPLGIPAIGAFLPTWLSLNASR